MTEQARPPRAASLASRREISVYDRMCWPEGDLERALAGGAHRRELIAWFGEGEYRRLVALARSQTGGARLRTGRKRQARCRVYVIPGLLGSQLGSPRPDGQPFDLLWLDPSDIAAGRMLELRQSSRGEQLTALGVIPHTYLALKLRLTAAGYDVVMYDYDWRDDIALIARRLVARLEADEASGLALIGHSMGGLVARAALGACNTACSRRIERLIGLGTPHGGSIGAVQALRATYPVVLRLAALDQLHDARLLGERVFRGFVSLYQMLPAAVDGLDLLSPSSWPAAGLRPRRSLLSAAREFRHSLPAADERFVSIVGTGQRTVTGIARRGGQFHYEVSSAGDGTVPAAHATLSGASDYSLVCEHSELPRSPRVADALLELLRTGRTTRLRAGFQVRKGRCVSVSDAMLRRAFDQKVDWQSLSPLERRRYLNTLNAPPALYRAITPGAR